MFHKSVTINSHLQHFMKWAITSKLAIIGDADPGIASSDWIGLTVALTRLGAARLALLIPICSMGLQMLHGMKIFELEKVALFMLGNKF